MTVEVVTIWIALTDVTADLGPLFLIKGSHLFSEHLSETKGFDLMKQNERSASIKEHPEEYAKRNNTCLLTKEFMAGDVLLFPSHMLHGVSPHNSDIIRKTFSFNVIVTNVE